MSSKKNNFVYLDNKKYDLFKKEVDNNRKANDFRKATNELLQSKQIVLTVTIDPCTNEILYTGDKVLIEKIEERNSHEIMLSDIESLMLDMTKDENQDFSFSELDQGYKKDYHGNDCVTKLPKLKISPDSDDWTAVIGRKIVEMYMKDLRMRDDLSDNKKKDKIPTWYPKDVKKYASNLDKEASKKVMNAILIQFPEIEEDYRLHRSNNDTPIRKKRIEQTHKDSPSKKFNLMKTLSPKQKTQRERSKSPYDDLRKKMAYTKIGLTPKEGWNVWAVKKKFQMEKETLDRTMKNI